MEIICKGRIFIDILGQKIEYFLTTCGHQKWTLFQVSSLSMSGSKVSPYVILCDICKVSLALDPPLLALDFSFDFGSGW